MDLPSMLFLPELLYRFSFPGDLIAPGKLGTTPRKPMTEGRAKWGAGSEQFGA